MEDGQSRGADTKATQDPLKLLKWFAGYSPIHCDLGSLVSERLQPLSGEDRCDQTLSPLGPILCEDADEPVVESRLSILPAVTVWSEGAYPVGKFQVVPMNGLFSRGGTLRIMEDQHGGLRMLWAYFSCQRSKDIQAGPIDCIGVDHRQRALVHRRCDAAEGFDGFPEPVAAFRRDDDVCP